MVTYSKAGAKAVVKTRSSKEECGISLGDLPVESHFVLLAFRSISNLNIANNIEVVISDCTVEASPVDTLPRQQSPWKLLEIILVDTNQVSIGLHNQGDIKILDWTSMKRNG